KLIKCCANLFRSKIMHKFSENLLEEGIYNELCSFIQGFRKKLELNLSDEIEVHFYVRANQPCQVTILQRDNDKIIGSSTDEFDFDRFAKNQEVAEGYLLVLRGLAYVSNKLQIKTMH